MSVRTMLKNVYQHRPCSQSKKHKIEKGVGSESERSLISKGS
jgi:hypothetical protein